MEQSTGLNNMPVPIKSETWRVNAPRTWNGHKAMNQQGHIFSWSFREYLIESYPHVRYSRVERPQDSIVACAYEAFTDAPRISNASQS
jgi:hypothetical protein